MIQWIEQAAAAHPTISATIMILLVLAVASILSWLFSNNLDEE